MYKYNEQNPEDNNYLFVGFATTNAAINKINYSQFFGKWTVNGETFSTVGSGCSSSGGVNTVPSTPKNILTYLHDKVHLIENEECNIYKDSFYLNGDGGMYANLQDIITEVLDSMSLMIERIHEQLPNVVVGIIASPRWSYARTENYQFCILPFV